MSSCEFLIDNCMQHNGLAVNQVQFSGTRDEACHPVLLALTVKESGNNPPVDFFNF
jgi:hypothetical protein